MDTAVAIDNRRHSRTAAERFASLLAQACSPAAPSERAALALAACAIEHRHAAGKVLLSRGEPAGSLWLVASGSVALGTRGEVGMRQHSHSVEAGSWADVASAWLHGTYLEDAVCQTEAVLWELPLFAVLHCGNQHPELMAALATALAGRVSQLTEGTRSLMTKDVQARCAGWLLEHARMLPAGEGQLRGEVSLHQRKRTIALQLGTTAETFSRTLSQLSRLGLIDVHGYTIDLLDVPGLRRLAEVQTGRCETRLETFVRLRKGGAMVNGQAGALS